MNDNPVPSTSGSPGWMATVVNSLLHPRNWPAPISFFASCLSVFVNVPNAYRLLNGRDVAYLWFIFGVLVTGVAVILAIAVFRVLANQFWRGMAVGGAIVALIGLAPLLVAYGSQTTTVTIRLPEDGQLVGPSVHVEGRFSKLSDGRSIWVVVAPNGLREYLYHPQIGPAEKSYGGAWEAQIFVGLDDPADYGRRFDIYAVTGDEIAKQRFEEYFRNARNTGSWPGLPSLPDGTKIEDKITVTRRTESPTPTPTPSPSPTPTPAPPRTATPTPPPTVTPAPTPTPLPTPTPTPPSTPTLSVAVDQPVEAAAVDVQTTIKGHSAGLQPGKPPYVYVFVRPLPGQPGYWFAQNPVDLQPDGTWTNTSYIGVPTDPAGTPFKLCAVISGRPFQPNDQLTDDEFSGLEEGPSFCISLQRR